MQSKFHLFVVFPLVAVGLGAFSNALAGPSISNPKVFGRVMYDYAYAEGDDTAFAVDDSEFRNVRLGVKWAIGKTRFKIEAHTDESGDVILTDAYLETKFIDNWPKLKIGQFKTPNSLDELSSSRFITMHERAAFTDAFEFNRRIGAMLAGNVSRIKYTFGVFAQNIEDETFGGYALAGRISSTHTTDKSDLTVHTGVSFRYRDIDTGAFEFRYRQRPVTHIPGRLLNTGRIAASDFFTGFELAAVKGRYWAAGEYGLMAANCPSCVDDPNFTGGYVEAGVMFGGKRTLKKGKFNRPVLNGGPLGAASLAVRYDRIDLASSEINGGSYDAVVVGADWWPKDFIRLGINGFITDAELGNVASGLDAEIAAAVTANIPNETVKGLTLRAQFDF